MPLTIATLNVKNLLAARDDRERAVLPSKVAWIARTLQACDADVVGLQEVGPPELLADVLHALERLRQLDVDRRAPYGDPILGTADARGIRCALLARLPVLEHQVHTAESLSFPRFVQGDPPPFAGRIPLRRGVVRARVEAPGIGPVDVLVVHFKSSRPVGVRDAAGVELAPATARERAEGMLRSLVWRAAEALHVRGIVDGLLASEAPPEVAVVGDFNDVPGSLVVRTVAADGDGALIDASARVPPAERFSAIHDGSRSQIDHVLVSPRLYARIDAARFLNAELREHVAPPRAPAADDEHGASADVRYDSADSDHAALVVRFG